MRQWMDKMLRRYGVEARVGNVQTHIFLQPSTAKSWQSRSQSMGPLGMIPGGQYLYIGPAQVQIRPGDCVSVGDQGYILRRTEAIRDREGTVYHWGLCLEKGGDDTWG